MDESRESLDALTPIRLDGTEPLTNEGEELPLTVCDFWQWSASDLVSNLTRARFAEFIIAHALGIDVTRGVRKEWDAYDLITPDGIKVEVKTSAYVQTWRQTALSKIAWSLGPTRAWVDKTNQRSSEIAWQADVYVLALFASEQKGTTHDPLDLSRWRFFVVPVNKLEVYARKVTLTLQTLETFGIGGVGYSQLGDAVRAVLKHRV